MNGTLSVLVADPDARVVEADTGTWVVSGVDADALERCVREADAVDDVKESVPSIAEDAVLLNVEDDAGRTVHAYRSVVGSRRLYYLRTRDGGFVATDSLRNALAQLPVEARTVPDEHVVDHLLFRAPVGCAGYVDGVDAVAQGSWLTWDLATDERTTDRIGHLSPSRRLSPERAPDAVADTYRELLTTDAFDGELINLFSGGVDSTLTQTFVDDRASMLNVGIDSPEYEFEMEYAESSADHFDTSLEQVVLDEDDVLAHLEASIDATASPSCPFQTVLLNTALGRETDRRYVMAVGADSVFGNTGTKGARIASWLSPLVGSALADPVSSVAPDPVGSYVGWLSTLADQLDQSSASPSSYAQQYSTYTNPELVSTMFDEAVVERRCRAQAAYARDRVDFDDSAGQFGRQVERRHMNLVFGHRVGARWRQLAYAHGNSLVNPFETRSMLECGMSVPASTRFVQGLDQVHDLSTKYLLKRLLTRRLPAYPIDREKGAGVLPFQRYLADGALADAFERYPVPDFVPDERRDSILHDSGRQAWNVLTYAVWRDRVQRNSDLSVVPSTDRLEWSVPTDGRTAVELEEK